MPAGYDAAFWESYRDRLEKASGAYHLRVDWRARVMDEAARTKARTALHGQKFDCLLVGSLDGNGIEVIDNNDPARRQVTVVTSDASLACAQVAKRIKAITHGSGMVLVVAAGLTPATDLLIAEIRIASPALKVEIRGPAALDAVGSAAVIYAADAGSTQDVLRAVERRGRTGKVKVIGYGGGDALAASLEKGELDGLIMQKPVKMALQSIQAYSQFRLGEKVPPRISSNDLLITRDAIRTPRMRALLGLKPRPPVVGAAKSGGRNR